MNQRDTIDAERIRATPNVTGHDMQRGKKWFLGRSRIVHGRKVQTLLAMQPQFVLDVVVWSPFNDCYEKAKFVP